MVDNGVAFWACCCFSRLMMPDKPSCLWFYSMSFWPFIISCSYFRNSVPVTEIIKLIRGPVTCFPCKCNQKEIWLPSSGIQLLNSFIVRDSGHFLFRFVEYVFIFLHLLRKEEKKVILFSNYFLLHSKKKKKFGLITTQKPRISNHIKMLKNVAITSALWY